ncbi:MAG: hypothetical protein KJT03_24015, partial [Verrucomicrobiae bacterium]|nr:hypothetical protein [Verrucomicrobiae bacterium]
ENDGIGEGSSTSLREAIQLAGLSNHRILFTGTVFPETITLDKGQLGIPADQPGLFIDASDIPNGVTISGNEMSRVFDIGQTASLALHNLTITLGKTSGVENGGGIFINGRGTLALNDSTVTLNQTAASGGGIYVSEAGSAVVNHSTVSKNQAMSGGGIFSDKSMLVISGSVVSGNRTSGPAYSRIHGGGIASDSGSLEIHSSAIVDNRVGDGTNSSSLGGGVYSIYGSASIDNSTIANNSVGTRAEGTDGEDGRPTGGGVVAESGEKLTIRNTTITGNSSFGEVGGLISDGTSLILESSIITGNIGSNNQGDVYYYDFNDQPIKHYGVSIIGAAGGSPENPFEGATILSADSMLAPLGTYGGPTPTMPPLPGSPAI